MHTGHADVRGNNLAVPITRKRTTAAEVMRAAGYATACIGKWGIGDRGKPGEPLKHGFDVFVGLQNEDLREDRYYPAAMVHGAERVELRGNTEARKIYSEDVFIDEAERFIREHADGPFFLYSSFCLPHAPLDVPAEAMQPYVDLFDPETPFDEPVDEPDGLYRAQPRPLCGNGEPARRELRPHVDRRVRTTAAARAPLLGALGDEQSGEPAWPAGAAEGRWKVVG